MCRRLLRSSTPTHRDKSRLWLRAKELSWIPSSQSSDFSCFFYWMINLGSLSAIATTEMEHHLSFWPPYLLPLAMFSVAVIALVYGKRYYYSRRPRGSVILNAVRVLWIAIRQGFSLEAAKPSYCDLHACKYETQWSDLFVDEIRRALVACRIFVFFPTASHLHGLC